eukprot:15458669-Alexandrium_andersonii.AAC.1
MPPPDRPAWRTAAPPGASRCPGPSEEARSPRSAFQCCRGPGWPVGPLPRPGWGAEGAGAGSINPSPRSPR